MNAALPYLKQIAEALKKIKANGGFGSSSGTSSSSFPTSIAVGGSVNTADIITKIEEALVVTSTEEVEVDGGETQEVEVRQSIYEVMKDDLSSQLHAAFFKTVSEQQGGQTVEVEKNLLEMIAEDLTALARLNTPEVEQQSET